MRKKIVRNIIIAAFMAGISGTVLADESTKVSLCPFEEDVVIRSAPAGSKILSLTGDHLAVKQIGESEFLIRNNRNCDNGTATVRIGTNDQNYSQVTFHDGPWMFMDIKSVNNIGNIRFDHWDKDHGRHSYKLYFK